MARKKKNSKSRVLEALQDPTQTPKAPPSNVCASGLHAVSPLKGMCECGHFQQRYFTKEELAMLTVLFSLIRAQKKPKTDVGSEKADANKS